MSDENPTGSILVRRGPTADRLAFCPLKSEIIYDTTTNRFYIGDGQTYGGVSTVEREFPNTGVMVKGTSAEEFLVAPGSNSAGAPAVQFLSYEKNTGDYTFTTISSSGVAITSLQLNGGTGITVTRTDSDPDVVNPTITTTGQVTFSLDTGTLFASPAFTGTATQNGVPLATTATVLAYNLAF